MIHFGRNPQGELEIKATGSDVGLLYRAISAAYLPERGEIYALKAYLEDNFKDELTTNYKTKGGDGHGNE
jgi:hypothetical protein